MVCGYMASAFTGSMISKSIPLRRESSTLMSSPKIRELSVRITGWTLRLTHLMNLKAGRMVLTMLKFLDIQLGTKLND